jgi:diacylglycerol kinase family enzyme
VASPPRRILIVANPRAGLRRGIDAGARVARAIAGCGRAIVLHRTTAPGDARQAARAAAEEGYDLVIAVGGDGTAHEAANGVAGSATALAIAPAGTMNLLARLLGVPLEAAQAAALAVRAGRRRCVRPGRAGETLFLLMAGIGFDAWVLRTLLDRSSGKIRFRDYARGALGALAGYPFPRVRFEHDAGTFDGHSGIVGRAPLYGGFLRPTPRARLEEDVFELCVLSARRAGMLRLAPALWSGAHLGRGGVASAMSACVRASSDDPDVPVQLDGEPAGRLPMSFSIARETLILAA